MTPMNLAPDLPDPSMDDAARREFFKRTAPVEDVKFFMRAVGPLHPCYAEAGELLDALLLRKGKPSPETKRRYTILHEHWRGYARTSAVDHQEHLTRPADAEQKTAKLRTRKQRGGDFQTSRNPQWDTNERRHDEYFARFMTPEIDEDLRTLTPEALVAKYDARTLALAMTANRAIWSLERAAGNDDREHFDVLDDALRAAADARPDQTPVVPLVGAPENHDDRDACYLRYDDGGKKAHTKKTYLDPDGHEWVYFNGSSWWRCVPAASYDGPTITYAEHYAKLCGPSSSMLTYQNREVTPEEIMAAWEHDFIADQIRGIIEPGTTFTVRGKTYVFTGERGALVKAATAPKPQAPALTRSRRATATTTAPAIPTPAPATAALTPGQKAAATRRARLAGLIPGPQPTPVASTDDLAERRRAAARKAVETRRARQAAA